MYTHDIHITQVSDPGAAVYLSEQAHSFLSTGENRDHSHWDISCITGLIGKFSLYEASDEFGDYTELRADFLRSIAKSDRQITLMRNALYGIAKYAFELGQVDVLKSAETDHDRTYEQALANVGYVRHPDDPSRLFLPNYDPFFVLDEEDISHIADEDPLTQLLRNSRVAFGNMGEQAQVKIVRQPLNSQILAA